MERPGGTERGAVVLLPPVSVELRNQKSCVAIFRSSTCLCIEGCVFLRVLAGAVHVHGYTLTPSNAYHGLVSPKNWGRSVISAGDQTLRQRQQNRTIVFVSVSDEKHDGRISLGLPVNEIKRINMLMETRHWMKDVACLALLKESNNLLTQSLQLHPHTRSLFCGAQGMVIGENFCIRHFQQADATKKGVRFPPIYRKVAADVRDSTVTNPVVVVCGAKNSGKSTFCQFLINSLLNSERSVAYLECDVGQSEFTLPGVVSLFRITEPVFGPPCAHLRRPEKAYFFGDNSPKSEPDYFLSLIKRCLDHYWKEVASKRHRTVLVVNQCGWVTDLGLPVLVDIFRMVSPSHIIQLVLDAHQQLFDRCFLDSEPGWRTRSKNVPDPKALMEDLAWFSSMRTYRRHRASDSPILITDELDDPPLEDVDSSKEDGEEGPPRKRRKEGDLLLPGGRTQLHQEVAMARWNWQSMGPRCNLCVINLARVGVSLLVKNSVRSRLMNYVAYFSPLLGMLPSNTPANQVHNFLQAATPYEVPWRQVAVHSLLVKVPFSQILYAINGQFVALVNVPEDEIKEGSDRCFVRSVRSQHPQGEFIGVGLVRGIDSERRVFFITTPEPKDCLVQVNCLMLGKLESPCELVHHVDNQR